MNNNPLIKVSLKWGLIYAGISCLSLLGTYLFGPMTNKTMGVIIGVISFAIMITILVLSNNEYKNKYLGGYIKYGQCLVNSILIFVLSTLVLTLLTFLIYGVVDVEAFNKIIENQLLEISSNDKMPQEVKQKTIDMWVAMTPLKYAAFNLVGIVWGVIISLIVSIFTRKKNNSFDGAIKEIE